MNHADFLAVAVRLSIENVEAGHGGPFGAIIVRNGEIIARGQNRVTATHDPTAHAEIVAIREACRVEAAFSLAGCVLYSSCEPCPMCLAAAYWARLEAVYFAATQEDAANAGFDDAFLYREFVLPLKSRALPALGLPDARPDAREAFTRWKHITEKTPY